MNSQQQSDLAVSLMRTAIEINQKHPQSVHVIYSGDANWVEILVYREKDSMETIFHETVDLGRYDAEMVDLVREALNELLETGSLPADDESKSNIQALLPNN